MLQVFYNNLETSDKHGADVCPLKIAWQILLLLHNGVRDVLTTETDVIFIFSILYFVCLHFFLFLLSVSVSGCAQLN